MSNLDELFGNAGGGGNFPKVEDFEGKLIIIKPTLIESVPKPSQFGGKPGEMQDRLTADVVIFEEDGEYELVEDMYLSQKSFVSSGRKHLKRGAKPFILGRVAKVPSAIGKAQAGKYDSTEKIEAGLAEYLRKGAKGEKPNYAWGLNDFTPEDKAMAMKYVIDSGPLSSADE